MSLIQTGPLVGDIRGKLGGVEFKRNAGGLGAQGTPKRAASLTRAQVNRAEGVASYNAQWAAMTAAKRDDWGRAIGPGRTGREKFLSWANRTFPFAGFDLGALPVPARALQDVTPGGMWDPSGIVYTGTWPLVLAPFQLWLRLMEPWPPTRAAGRGRMIYLEPFGLLAQNGQTNGAAMERVEGDAAQETTVVATANVWAWEGWVRPEVPSGDPGNWLVRTGITGLRYDQAGDLIIVSNFGSIEIGGGATLNMQSWNHVAIDCDITTQTQRVWLNGVKYYDAAGLLMSGPAGTYGVGAVPGVGGNGVEGSIGKWSWRNDFWSDGDEVFEWNGGAGSQITIGAPIGVVVSQLITEWGDTVYWAADGFTVSLPVVGPQSRGVQAFQLVGNSEIRLDPALTRLEGWGFDVSAFPTAMLGLGLMRP